MTDARRWLALDLLRSLAVVLMVQGHTFTVLLDERIQRAAWYSFHRFVHGFTAPIFLFGSGLAFGVTTCARFREHIVWGEAAQRRLRRYLVLLAVGYAPSLSLVRVVSEPDRLAWFSRVGPLQLIAVLLGACELCVLAVRRERRFFTLAGAGAVAVAVVSPIVWRGELSAVFPAPLAAYVDERGGSLFPIFPWGAFLLAGVAAGGFVAHRRRTPDPRVGRRFLAFGVAVVGASWALWRAGVNPYGEHDFWRTSPIFIAFRLGVVCCVVAASAGLEHWVRSRTTAADGTKARGPVLDLAALLARHSLIAYVVHLLILYGSPLWPSLEREVGRTLGLPATTAGFVGVFAVTVAATKTWDALRRDGRRTFGVVRFSLASVLVYSLLLRG